MNLDLFYLNKYNLAAISRDDSQVSRDLVSTFYLHQISNYQFLSVDALLLAIADHQCLLQCQMKDTVLGTQLYMLRFLLYSHTHHNLFSFT